MGGRPKLRDAPYQFNLKTLLVAMAIAGLCVWAMVQLVVLPPGYIWGKDTSLVVVGMTEQEVSKVIGEPIQKSVTTSDTNVWMYRLAYATRRRKHFAVVFVDGEVRMPFRR